MKTTAKLFALMLLALPTTMQAQLYEGAISEAFEEILKKDGITHSTSQSLQRDGQGGTAEKTIIHEFAIGASNFELLDEVVKAFERDERDASTFYTCFNPMQDGYRQNWAVKMKQGEFRIGEKPGSSYAIATFDDDYRQGFRTVYAVEWWKSKDPLIRQGIMVSSYGEKPAMQAYQAQMSPNNHIDMLLPRQSNWPDSVLRNWGHSQAMQIADSVFEQQFGMPDIPLSKRYRLVVQDAAPEDIPLDGNQGAWMSKAISRINNLSNNDWHRVFGLLTQQMMDRANKEKKEDMVVAAGVVLNLCKHADQLDQDEKEVCFRRLNEVQGVLLHINGLDYVCDMLQLAANKLIQKKK